jgi:putative peptidoglycan lipid II flippase
VLLALAGPLLLLVLIPDGHDGGGRLAVTLFFLLLPTLLLNGASVAWAAVLGAEERYTRSVAPQLLAPIVPLVAVLAISGSDPSVVWLAVATSIGFAIEAAATGWLLHREGVPIFPRRLPSDPDRRTVVSQFLPVAAGGCLMASTLLVDQAMSVRLGTGSVAALSFGSKAAAFLTSVGALALTTAALPHFSKVVALGDRDELVSGLKHWTRIILAVSVPATVVMIALSHPIVELVFQRGAFTAEDTELVSQVQQLFLLQLPAYLIGVVVVRAISALKANVILLWGAGLNLAVNVGLNIVLGAWLGVPGIALSTSVVYWVSTAFLGLMLIRHLPTKDPDEH